MSTKAPQKILGLAVYCGRKIKAVDGTNSFVKSGIFHFITPSFVNTYEGHVTEATPETGIIEYRVVRRGTLKDAFDQLFDGGPDFAFTEHQIAELVQRDAGLMMRNTTYFFFKYRGHIVPASIFFNNGFGLDIYTKGLDDETTSLPFGACVIIPQ